MGGPELDELSAFTCIDGEADPQATNRGQGYGTCNWPQPIVSDDSSWGGKHGRDGEQSPMKSSREAGKRDKGKRLVQETAAATAVQANVTMAVQPAKRTPAYWRKGV
jgi:hypothetical protein